MKSGRTRHLLTAMPMALALAAVTACGGGGEGGAAREGEDGKVSVVTSTNVWGSVVRAVGGEHVQVNALISDAAADPHSYEASAEDAADVQSAQLLVYNGGGYDDFFAQLAERAPDAEPVVAVEGEAGHDHGAEPEGGEHGHDHGHGHGHGNEHVWYDLHIVGDVAEQVANRLGEIVPQQRETFTRNAQAFIDQLTELEGEIERIGPGRVVATEPVAHYLLEAAGVTDATPREFSQAIENETDVPVAAQQQVLDLVSGKGVDAVVNNPQTVTPATEKIVGAARNAGVPVVDLTETLPEGTTDYIAWMRSQIESLAGALGT